MRDDEKTIRFISFNLFIFFVATYLLTASGAAFSDVAQMRVEVARSIIERLDLNVPSGMGMIGADGREYSWFGIGSVVLFIPFFLFGKLAGLPPENVVSVMNHFFGAATAILVFLFSIALGYSRRASVFVSMIYGLGTMAWYYSKDSGDHTIETFFILFTIYSMYRYTAHRKAAYLLFSALSFGFSLITRPTALLIIPSLFIMLFFCDIKKNNFTVAAGDGMPPIVGPPLETYFDWHMSPILMQFKFVREIALNLKKYTYVQPSKEPLTAETITSALEMNVFDFWWLYRYFMEGSYSGFIAALLLLLISLFSATRVWKSVS